MSRHRGVRPVATCSGERLSGRLIGVIVDDPVTDSAAIGREPPDAHLTIYWTGALDEIARPGTGRDVVDWTCAGNVVRGIDAYAADLGVAPIASPFDEHLP